MILRFARSSDAACVAALLAVTLAVYAPALFGGKVLLPADIVPLMAPYAPAAREKFPDFRFAQNQLHGPIFEYYSWRFYAREQIRAGQVPLWNPYELSGNVLLANSQSAVLYPPNILLYVFSLPGGINLVTALHTFLTGLFMFGLLRTRGLSAPAGLTGAFVWMFCGLQVGWTEFQTPTAALCWLPGILWGWELNARGGGWRWAVYGSGAGIALSLLAGHLHFAFYVLLAFVLYGGATCAARRQALAPLAGALAFGVLLSMAVTLPVMEMSRLNFRGIKTYQESVVLAVPPANLLTLAMPNLFGNPRDYVAFDPQGAPVEGFPYWGKFDFIEYACYLGIPALMLGLVGILDLGFAAARRKQACSAGEVLTGTMGGSGIFLLIAVVGLLLALGSPLCALFFYGVPGYRQFNATARSLCLVCFGLAALSACGLEALTLGSDRKRALRQFVAAAIGAAALGLIAFPGMGLIWNRLFSDKWLPYEMAGVKHFWLFLVLTSAAVWLALRDTGRRILWLIPALAAGDLLVWSAGFNPVTDPAMLDHHSETTRILGGAAPARAASFEAPGGGIKSFLVPNFNAVAGYREIQGADSLHTLRYHRLMEAVARAIDPSRNPPFTDPNTVRIPPGGHPVLDMLNLRYAATRAALPADRYRIFDTAELPVYENARALGPAWISPEAKRVNSLEEAFGILSSAPDIRRTALVETPVSDLYPPASTADRVEMTRFTPHRIELTARSSGEGILTIAEPYFPGWRAAVNGRPAEIISVNYILRGIRVSSGVQKVAMRYEPASYRVGLYFSGLAAAFLSGGLTGSLRRRKVT